MIWVDHETWSPLRQQFEYEWIVLGLWKLDDYLNLSSHEWVGKYPHPDYGINLYFKDPVDELAFKLKYTL